MFKKFFSRRDKYIYDDTDDFIDVFEELNEEYGIERRVREKKIERAAAKEVHSAEKILFAELEKGDDVVKYAAEIQDGNPVVMNFKKLNIDEANKALAFLAGFLYALRGETVNIHEGVYLFALKEEFKDGSLHAFVTEHS